MRPLLLAVLVLAPSALGQEPWNFDVASVKRAEPDANGRIFAMPPSGGPGTNDPGKIQWTGATLMNLLVTAYELKPYQVSGPDWMRSQRYDVVVKLPAGATKTQIPAMWQNMLKERFGLVVHQEWKEFAADELAAAKGGAKLKETTLDPGAAQPPETPAAGPGPRGMPAIQRRLDGSPELVRAGLIGLLQPGANGPMAHLMGRAQTMQDLAAYLGNELGHPVTDKTGLTGKYDFYVDYKPDLAGSGSSPGAAPDGPDPGGDLATVLQQQLGLRLVKGKAPLMMIVVDRAEKTPSSN